MALRELVARLGFEADLTEANRFDKKIDSTKKNIGRALFSSRRRAYLLDSRHLLSRLVATQAAHAKRGKR